LNDSGQEVGYYEHVLEGVKINSFSPMMANVKHKDIENLPHIENVAMRYEKITHTYLDGNVSYSDSWIEGR
jgi:type VI secretion system secreted protein Hcp